MLPTYHRDSRSTHYYKRKIKLFQVIHTILAMRTNFPFCSCQHHTHRIKQSTKTKQTRTLTNRTHDIAICLVCLFFLHPVPFLLVQSILILHYSTLLIPTTATAIISRESSRNTFIIQIVPSFCVPLSLPATLACLPIYVPTCRSILIPTPVSVCVFVCLPACTIFPNVFNCLLVDTRLPSFIVTHCSVTVPFPYRSNPPLHTFSQLLPTHASTTSLTFAHISLLRYPTV